MDEPEARTDLEVFEYHTEKGIVEVPVKAISASPAWQAVKERARQIATGELSPQDDVDTCRELGSLSLDINNQ